MLYNMVCGPAKHGMYRYLSKKNSPPGNHAKTVEKQAFPPWQKKLNPQGPTQTIEISQNRYENKLFACRRQRREIRVPLEGEQNSSCDH